MLVTKHEDKTFTGQTVYIGGQAFIRCHFVDCTLVMRQSVFHMEDCRFDRCNWHVDWLLLWADTASLNELKSLVALMEQLQQQQLPAEYRGQPAGAAPGAVQAPSITPAPRLSDGASQPRIQGVKPATPPPDSTSST